jgi:hypothetical protein
VLALELRLEQLGHTTHREAIENLILPDLLGCGTAHEARIIAGCHFGTYLGHSVRLVVARHAVVDGDPRGCALARAVDIRLARPAMFGTFSLTLSRVIAGLVRRTWLVALVTVATCSVFAAHAVAALASARYLDTPSSPAHHHAVTAVVETPAAPVPDGSALVERNMFCSACTPPATTHGPGLTDAFVPDATLIATSLGAYTVATLRVPATEVQGDFALGDIVPGLGEITRIGFTSIDVRASDGRTGTLSLLSRAAIASAPVAAAAPASIPGVRQLDATSYEVERSFVRDLVSGTATIGGTRMMPIVKSGKLEGLRLFGVRAGSPAASLGLQNGDVVEAINNTKIESANTLLDVYAQLDKLDTVELAGTRRGKPLTLTLRLR